MEGEVKKRFDDVTDFYSKNTNDPNVFILYTEHGGTTYKIHYCTYLKNGQFEVTDSGAISRDEFQINR